MGLGWRWIFPGGVLCVGCFVWAASAAQGWKNLGSIQDIRKNSTNRRGLGHGFYMLVKMQMGMGYREEFPWLMTVRYCWDE